MMDAPREPRHQAARLILILEGRDMFLLAETTHYVYSGGISLGSALAVVCSWQRNRSIILAIIAGIFSWFYVIYFALTRRPDEFR